MITSKIDSKFNALFDLVTDIYGAGAVPLHRPVFEGNERQYLVDCIDSNFVSSVGEKVTEFERQIADFVGCRHAIATVNGTAALHLALVVAGVGRGDEVLSQALTFVATCNAINYIGARPVFVDVDRDTLGMSPIALRNWLEQNTRIENGLAYNITTGARISACVPMHTFGLPCRINEIANVCAEFGLVMVEDIAESLGSYIGENHTGVFGKLASLSFNGNKIITTGGGGMILTDDSEVAQKVKHLSTTAKIPHPWEFVHDEIGYNYRLPNLNAALGCAQMETLSTALEIKAEIATRYRTFCVENNIHFADAPERTRPNYWLNAILLENREERDVFLKNSNARGIMTRPIWTLISELAMFTKCQNDGLEHSRWLADRVVNLPSSIPETEFNRVST